MTDEEFLSAFEGLRIAPEHFNHHAHIRAAFLYLSRQPFLEACIAMRDSLKRFAAHIGKSDLYHETTTVAFMSILFERMVRTPALGWEELLARHPDLSGRGLLRRYYREETLQSAHAKRQFVLDGAFSEFMPVSGELL